MRSAMPDGPFLDSSDVSQVKTYDLASRGPAPDIPAEFVLRRTDGLAECRGGDRPRLFRRPRGFAVHAVARSATRAARPRRPHRNCWSSSASPRSTMTSCQATFPMACSGCCRWRWPTAPAPGCCCWTSPRRASAAATCRQLAEVLVDLRKRDVALVVIEHHMDLIMSIADRIVMIDQGVMLADRHAGGDPARSEGAGSLSGARRMTGVLQCEDLSVRYAGNVALSGVSLNVPAGKMVGLVGANGAGKIDAGQRARRLVARPRRSSRAKSASKARTSRAWRRISGSQRGLTLVPEGKNIFAELTVDENLALVRPPADIAGPSHLRYPGGLRVLSAPGGAAPPQGRRAVRRRAADARGRARAAGGPARADAGRAIGRAGAAADLGSVVAHPAAGRSRPAGAAGRAECEGGAEGGRPSLSAGARPHRRRRSGRCHGAPIIASSRPISERSPPETAHEHRPADRQRPRARFGLCAASRSAGPSCSASRGW